MKTQRGSTMIEAVGVLAIGLILTAGMSYMIDISSDETKSQQAAIYQSQVAAAAAEYIKNNYTSLLAQATTTTPAPPVPLSALQPEYLPNSFSPTNVYGQTPCLLVMKNAAGHLDALVVNEGGTQIAARDIGYASSKSGQGGGYIPSTTSGSPAPLIAKGAYNAWSLSNAALSAYLSAKCTTSAAGAGSLVTAMSYAGSGQQSSTGYLYRKAISERPELSTMTTPLYLKNQGGVAVENTSDALCAVGNPATYGGITTNAAGEVLSCQAGVWRRQNRFWREPVTTYASLPMTSNTVGDTRMVTGSVNRAFTWTGSSWAALSVDQNGDMVVPNKLQLNSTATLNAACQVGQVARDASGALMSCQSNVWNYVSKPELQYKDEIRNFVILRSKNISYPPGTLFSPPGVYDAPTNMHRVDSERSFTISKDAVVNIVYTSVMYNQLAYPPPDPRRTHTCVRIRIVDESVGASIRSFIQCGHSLQNDWAKRTITASHYLPKNAAGYTVKIETYFFVFGTANNVYDESNSILSDDGCGNVVIAEDTPLSVNWIIEVTS